MDELLEQFLIEGRDLVADANAALAALHDNPADARAIDAAFRAVHTLKGSVGLFDMAPAERLLHAAEDSLSLARKGEAKLAAVDLAALVATIDQVDRWIDELERDGALGPDASDIAEGLSVANAIEVRVESAPDWLTALVDRQQAAIRDSEMPLVAFRYVPDSDAFFRGEDPLALVATLPGIVAFDILPVVGQWPAPQAFEVFACVMAIEGLSSATADTLRPFFRLVPDQFTLLSAPTDAAAKAQGLAEPDAQAAATVLRVDAHRVDALADTVGELVVATNALAVLAERADAIDPPLALGIRAAQADLERAVGTASRAVSAVRLVSLAPALRRLPRLVREIAVSLGKEIRFVMTGEQTEVDKQIADGLFEPLLHLVRNAIDHGIENATGRAHAGKLPTGNLTLAIMRKADDVVVTLADDGAGIDRDHIRTTAVDRGLITAEASEALSDAGTLALIFAPGFSTAQAVSSVSGRGVGMDAVQAAIDRMRGRIEIDSVAGQGTRFTLRLPANAITTRLLVIDVANDRYAVPFDQIAETVRIDSDKLAPVGTGMACVLPDRTVPVLSLAEMLGGTDRGASPVKLLVTCASGVPVALRVDGFHERLDAMVRPPSGLLASMPLIGGTTTMGDGAVLLVLNMAEVIG
ncbi:MAG: Hpt domain-containing protein [Sphingomonadaceae bacterium]|nr:Hpt domain-containing protein [Sphingomonadaceae bacterium]